MAEREQVDRISLSLPAGLLERFDMLVDERGFDSRSQAVGELISRELDRYSASQGRQIMTGTIVLVYGHTNGDLKRRLADIQYDHIAEVIGSLHILLEKEHTMEVVIVQGKANKLRKIANELITCKGVTSGSMTLTSSLMPPVQYPVEVDDLTV
ncbi:nickel-responsive transcriptional regulator NikR [Roseibacillus persicicus]|uniref:nickel-responsive transcriptional regulator NikR n=1 Tax=Roseibacillus persicicus TaxID=454148 RepID=UPI0028105D49|nr:nickel-responsive transcriptional regulator NikR [Roseibacillus persicicus]MDQ8191545.1 nickel-responsive transcriptional regulator NikR [Roseibacillus persicicus]